jgi:hypothetical protein
LRAPQIYASPWGMANDLISELSWPLRRAILALDDVQFTDWARVLRQRRQRIKLVDLGLTEPYRNGPVTMWCRIRLTQLGREIKDRLIATKTPAR